MTQKILTFLYVISMICLINFLFAIGWTTNNPVLYIAASGLLGFHFEIPKFIMEKLQ